MTDQAPDLAGRTSRCSYPTHKKVDGDGFAHNNQGVGRNYKGTVRVEEPSRPDLPFFRHKPDEPHDEHYCGCWGWE